MNKSVEKSAAIVLALTVIQKITGFLREAVLAYFYGTSFLVDALFMANNASEIFMGLLTAAGVAFLPVYSKISAEDGTDAGRRFMNQLLTWVSLIGFIMGIFIMMSAENYFSMGCEGFQSL